MPIILHSFAVEKCSDPPTVSGGEFLGPSKAEYDVGEEVEYKCTKSGMKHKRFCLSDGTWSYSASECLGW